MVWSVIPGPPITEADKAYLQKANKVDPSIREFVREELNWLAAKLKEDLADMNDSEIHRFLFDVLNVSAH